MIILNRRRMNKANATPFYKKLGYVNDGLVAMWDGQYNVGTEIHDTNATKWVEMISGRESAVFTTQLLDGYGITVEAGYLELLSEGVSILLPNKPYTVEMVAEEIRKSSDTNAASGVLVGNTYTFGFFRHTSNNCWGPANYRMNNLYCSKVISEVTYSQIFPIASKSFVALDYNPTSTSNIRNAVDVYYNGTLRSGHLYSFQYGTAPTATDFIRVVGSSSGKHKYYNIRIYNRQLTADEIAANYAVDAERFNIT